jgi:hypothetical protein
VVSDTERGSSSRRALAQGCAMTGACSFTPFDLIELDGDDFVINQPLDRAN